VAPCQVTLWKASLDRCVAFIQAGHAISPAISLETAAALESTLEAVRRGARERMTAVLENRLRFAIDLDIDAPKVAIPFSSGDGSKVPQTQLILDFGHFTMRTDPEESPEDLSIEEQEMYSRFRVRASDISAWLVDGAYDWAQDKIEATSPESGMGSKGKEARQGMILPVLDKCGLAASIHQVGCA
jgi:vacuolar protein sorting-associated protein 13A/C